MADDPNLRDRRNRPPNQTAAERENQRRVGALADQTGAVQATPSYDPTGATGRSNASPTGSPINVNERGFGRGLTPEPEWRKAFPIAGQRMAESAPAPAPSRARPSFASPRGGAVAGAGAGAGDPEGRQGVNGNVPPDFDPSTIRRTPLGASGTGGTPAPAPAPAPSSSAQPAASTPPAAAAAAPPVALPAGPGGAATAALERAFPKWATLTPEQRRAALQSARSPAVAVGGPASVVSRGSQDFGAPDPRYVDVGRTNELRRQATQPRPEDIATADRAYQQQIRRDGTSDSTAASLGVVPARPIFRPVMGAARSVDAAPSAGSNPSPAPTSPGAGGAGMRAVSFRTPGAGAAPAAPPDGRPSFLRAAGNAAAGTVAQRVVAPVQAGVAGAQRAVGGLSRAIGRVPGVGPAWNQGASFVQRTVGMPAAVAGAAREAAPGVAAGLVRNAPAVRTAQMGANVAGQIREGARSLFRDFLQRYGQQRQPPQPQQPPTKKTPAGLVTAQYGS